MTTAIELEYLPIDALRADPANARRMSGAEIEALTRSVHQFGLVRPVVARREDGMIIEGDKLVTVARRLGLDTVPVVLLDVDQQTGRLLGIALNRIRGDWDLDLLARLLHELEQVPDIDLSLSGFAADEVNTLLRRLDARSRRERLEQFDVEAALVEMATTPRSRRGDRWRLGEHLVQCGDATDAADVAALLEGQPAAMAFTDPPYNVGYAGGTVARRRKIANDALPPPEWEAFCRSWGQQLLQAVDGAIYVCMSSQELPLVSSVLAQEGAHWSDSLIWAKDRFTLGRADYQRQYEPIWFGWREGANHFWCGDRDQGDVWTIERPAVSEAHPTTKPLALVERALENSSCVGDRVLDLFLGSGSTLISCERTGRRCLGLELDPLYVDLAVARWEAFTGERATRA
jgi:DNA modification methylase